MKKLLGIVVLAFLFSGNANAGVNEPGTGFLGKCKGALKWEHKKLNVKKFINNLFYRKGDVIRK